QERGNHARHTGPEQQGRQRRPPRPCSQSREQLHVATAKTVTTAHDTEQDIEATQKAVARRRTDDRIGGRGPLPGYRQQQTGPQQRQRDRVGQQTGSRVNEGQQQQRSTGHGGSKGAHGGIERGRQGRQKQR